MIGLRVRSGVLVPVIEQPCTPAQSCAGVHGMHHADPVHGATGAACRAAHGSRNFGSGDAV